MATTDSTVAITVDPNTLKHLVTFIILAIALIVISGLSDDARRVSLALIMIALIYEMLSGRGVQSLQWIQGKL